MPNTTRIESLGAFLPEVVMSMQERIDLMTKPPAFDPTAITGIQEIRVFHAEEDCLLAATKAAHDCLSHSTYSAQQLDIIISCSITRFIDGKERKHLWDPPLSLFIKDAIGASHALHFDVSNACAGMFTGLMILDRMIRAGTVKNGMVVSGEHATSVTDVALKEITDSYDAQFGSITVGDSGAAVILDHAINDEDCIDYFEMMSCAEHSHLCLGMPSDKNPGYALYTNNAEMHKKDRIKLWPQFQLDYYQKTGRSLAEEKFDHIIYHQVGTKFMHNASKTAMEMFHTAPPDYLSVVENFGNTATTSHFIVIYQALKNKLLKKGAKILLVPAASGMVTGFMSLTISTLKS